MSDQDPWGRRYRDDPRPPEELEEPDDPSSSVFARRTRPLPPDPQTRRYPGEPRPSAPQTPPRPDPYATPTAYPPATQAYPAQGGGPYAPPSTRQYPGQAPPPGYDEPRYREPPGRPPPQQYPPAGRQGRRGRVAEPRPEPQPDRRDRRDAKGRGLPIGFGALVGTVGLGCFLAALLVLPWFQVGSEDVTLSDIRTAFTVPETQPEDILPGAEDEPAAPEGPVPTPGEVTDAVEDAAQDAAAQAAASVVDTGKARYLELYVDRLWVVVAIGVSLAVLFSTYLAPRSFALSLILGFRRLSGFVTVLAGMAHGAALWVVFTGDGAPDPAPAVMLGLVGLAGVLLGCIVGPKRS